MSVADATTRSVSSRVTFAAGGKKSAATAPTNTTADPERLIAESELLLSLTVRERVVPEVVYVPVPISQLVPSSIT
jgi:hypothetical protein